MARLFCCLHMRCTAAHSQRRVVDKSAALAIVGAVTINPTRRLACLSRFRETRTILALGIFFLLQHGNSLLSQDGKKVRMAYSAFSISFLNIFVARDAGLFKKHGIEAELIQMAGPLPVAALASGEIDYLTGYTTGIVATGQGAPLKGIMISLRKPPFFLVADQTIHPNDLGGNRIGVDTCDSLQHLFARLMLKQKGADPEKVIFTQTGSVSNPVSSLAQGAISAAILS